MEKRSRQRVRDQVAHLAFGAESRMRSSARGYPWWPGTQRSVQGPDTDAQDQLSPDRHFRLATRGRSIQMGQKRKYELRVRKLLAELADVISQTAFHITRLVKSLLHQLLDSLLRGRPHDRGKAHIPLRCNFVVRRQTGDVGEALGLADRPLVERCDPGC